MVSPHKQKLQRGQKLISEKHLIVRERETDIHSVPLFPFLLHVLSFDRCLMDKGFVRIGKWFLKPYDVEEKSLGTR